MFTRALALLIGLPVVLIAGSPSASAEPAPARPAAVDGAPLLISIDSLSPSSLPERGPIQVRGRITNRDEVPWTTINLYPFISSAPITTRGALAEAAEIPAADFVGERITEVDDKVETLPPGASTTFSISVPRSVIAPAITGESGVYWFGVHAIAQSDEVPRDDVADGRARTFLPLIPAATKGAVRTSLVAPLRRFLGHEPDGSLSEPTAWLRSLSEGGRLREEVEFAAAAGPDQISWLVDPALLDAVRRLAIGNPARSLAPTIEPTAPGEEPSPSPTDGPDDGDGAESVERVTREQEAAAAWLTELEPLLRTQQLLTLPYGDLDLAGAADHDPALIELAGAQASTLLADWGISGTPVIGSPSGYVDVGTIQASDPETPVLVSDQAFVGDPPGVANLDGHKLVVASSAAATGGPAPGERINGIGLRQRILSEAAVRMLEPGRHPLVVVLPNSLTSERAVEFFEGLDVRWLDLTTLSRAAARDGRKVEPDDIDYPARQDELALDPETFRAADDLIADGEALQNLLTLNDRVGAELTEEALAGVSYTARQSQIASRTGLNRAVNWVQDKLRSVEIGAPPGVTLSSASGDFVATITNRLNEPVTVAVLARSDDGIEITPPERVELDAKSRTSVLLEARTSEASVHNVTLLLTDLDGTPLGSSDQLPIRSAQVSNVIWVIIGSGVGLLFIAILLRLVRRIRGRHDRPAEDAPLAETAAST